MMNDTGGLIAYLWRTRRRDAILVLAASATAALLQAGALHTISAAGSAALVASGIWPLASAIGLIKLTAVAKTGAMWLAVRAAERCCADTADTLSRRVGAAEFADIEALDREELFGRLGSDLRSLSAGIWALIPSLQSAMLIGACVLYMLVLAPEVTVLLAVLVAVGVVIYRPQSRRFAEAADGAVAAEDRFFARADDLLRGFKTLRTADECRADFMAAGLEPAARRARRMRSRSGRLIAVQTMTMDIVIYGVLGTAAFILPNADNHLVIAVVLTTLAYLVDRIDLLEIDLPVVSQGDNALARIADLIRRLPEPSGKAARPLGHFKTIDLQGVSFSYPNRDGNGWFLLGPVDLRIGQPEIVLIAGGNGSGKSTLMKLLTGLYRPGAGTVLVDGRAVSAEAYRGLFSAVFSDYHLFTDLYGVACDPEEVASLLALLGLQHVVHFKDGRFSTLALSTGQRKRLALAAAWLERRPVLVLDEWTADQDPEFRQLFFTRLLPELKGQGRTVVAVTHDDRYFHYGDRLIRIEGGRIVQDIRNDDAEARSAEATA